MSHELRTPLNAILGFGELLERDESAGRPARAAAPDHAAPAGTCSSSSTRCSTSRASTRRAAACRSSPCIVGQVVTEALEMLAPLAAARSVTLGLAALRASSTHYVLADRQRLKQVLLNLLSNAVKYNREAGEVPSRRAGRRRKHPHHGRRHGPRHRARRLERVFAAFERLGAEATESRAPGSGSRWSSASSRRWAARSASRASSARARRSGCCSRSRPAPHPRADRDAADPGASAAHGPARTVLYIEDNPSNIRLVETDPARAPGDHAARRDRRAARAGPRARAPPGARPARSQPARHLGRGGAAPAARRRAHRGVPVVMVSADATVGQVARLRSRRRRLPHQAV